MQQNHLCAGYTYIKILACSLKICQGPNSDETYVRHAIEKCIIMQVWFHQWIAAMITFCQSTNWIQPWYTPAGIDRVRAAENGNYTAILEKINGYLSEELGDKYNGYHEDFTDVALKFGYSLPDGTILDVDLLLSPYWKEGELLSFLRTVHPPVRRLMYAWCVTDCSTNLSKIYNIASLVENVLPREYVTKRMCYQRMCYQVANFPGPLAD